MRKNFEEVYVNLAASVKRFIAKRSGEPEEVIEDIFSQTMIAAWKGFNSFGNKSSYFTWICKIALHKIADYYRQEIHQNSSLIAPLLEDLVEPESTTPLESLALQELQIAVKRALDLLPASMQKIIHLRYWEEASVVEIAKVLGVTPKAAESKLYRAKKAFSKVVARKGLLKV